MMTLIGSRAMYHWFKDARPPAVNADWDYITDCEVGSVHADPEDRIDVFENPLIGRWPFEEIADMDELYTLKISHSFWEINNDSQNWDKHAADIVFLERHGAVFLRELYDILLPIWKQRYAKKKTDLTKNKKDFFTDAVVRKYDHDSLHRSVAYTCCPMYEHVLKDGSEVDCDWGKFLGLTHEEQIQLCREEVMVTALERILVPAWDLGKPTSPRWAYHWALRRTITSLFKGEWALFMLLNLNELMAPDCDYVQRHRDNSDKLIVLEAPSGN